MSILASFTNFFSNAIEIKDKFFTETMTTLYMVGFTAFIAGVIGVLIGVVLVVTEKGRVLENKALFGFLDKTINILRSVPFIIMLAAIAPLTRLIVGSSIGATAAIVPLAIGTIPFFSRQVQNALVEVDSGVVEAAQAMGNSPSEIIFGVYLKEGLAGIIRAASVTIVNLIGLTAMAGAIGAGGLGRLAIAVGYNRFQDDVTLVATLIIMILVFISQSIGNFLVKKATH
ncbi:MAG: ABC transporter permease [Clostridioides sp.]|jgi:D-methionine transport system permease protein|nr:ABC transporter permease [Clostridioides sp.]